MTEQERLFAGGGEVGALMRAKDWSQTPLGPVEGWPPALRIAIGVMLALPTPVALYWGRDFVMLYNDATRSTIGAMHPAALGVSARTTFGPHWELLGGMFDHVTRTQTTATVENQPIFLNRKGFAEEGYFTFSYAPLTDERAQSVGVFAIANETTGQVVGERRLKALRELSLQAAHAQDTERVLSAAGEVIAQSGHDMPFALLYRKDGERFRLVVHSGLKAGSRAAPQEAGLEPEVSSWPLAEALRSTEAGLLEDVRPRMGDVHAGPWPEPVERALLLPLSLEGEPHPDAVLVLGLSPRLPLDMPYRDFLQLLARQLVADIVRVRALEQEKQRAAQLAEVDRVKTAFFSNVSHEFRTPLTLMLGPTEAALASPEQALRGEELRRVHRNELRLLKLVNSLLDLSRLEAGRTQGRFVPTDLAPLTAGLASGFDSIMAKAGLRLTVDCPALPEPVWVDPDLWEKVVLNLVSNAFKYTLKGDITVRLRWKGTHAELSVQDTGTGIALEQQALIFERFHRVEGARGRSDEGTGIGLSLVRELVELHGGRVSVRSVPGEGSTFTVELSAGRAHLPPERVLQEPPRVSTATGSRAFVQEAEQWTEATPEEAEELELPAPSGEGPRGHVLLADDNADMRDYLARLLQGHFRVDAVADGQAALEAARAHPPDLVVSDVMMPRLDGFGLVRELKADARTAHVPVLLLSARASEKATLEGFAAGGVDYMVKPFRARELLARVGALVKTAQAQAEVAAARQRAEVLSQQMAERVDFEQKLMGIVSHDLRNPLSAIMMGTALLARREDIDARTTKSLVRIQASAERATRMVKDLLDFTQARLGGGLRIDRHAMDLHQVMRGVVDEVEVAWPTRTVEVCQEGDGQGDWDADRLAQVTQNLVTNALKYSPEDSVVRISTRGEGKEVSLSVANGGPPIPSDKLTSIFEPMQRATAELDMANRSVGLGLYIVKSIVEAHGGRIGVTSTQQEGTRFTVWLPRQASPARGGLSSERGHTPRR